MTNPLSPSKSRNKGFTRELLGKVQDMLGHAVLRCDVFFQVTTEQLDQFVKIMGPGIIREWLRILKDRLVFFNRSRIVEVDYGGFPQKTHEVAFSESVKALRKFTSAIDMDNIEISGRVGSVSCRVFELCFDHDVQFSDLEYAIKSKSEELGFTYPLLQVDPPTFVKLVSASNSSAKEDSAFSFVTCCRGYDGEQFVMFGFEYEKKVAIMQCVSGMKFSKGIRFLVYISGFGH